MTDRTARVPRFGTPGSRSPQPPDRSTLRLLRNSLLVALAVALCALLLPAASISGPIEDCADDGQLQGNYSDQQKQQALKDLPSDLSEYSDCGEILNTPNPSKPGGRCRRGRRRRHRLRWRRRGRHHDRAVDGPRPALQGRARPPAAREGRHRGAGQRRREAEPPPRRQVDQPRRRRPLQPGRRHPRGAHPDQARPDRRGAARHRRHRGRRPPALPAALRSPLRIPGQPGSCRAPTSLAEP